MWSELPQALAWLEAQGARCIVLSGERPVQAVGGAATCGAAVAAGREPPSLLWEHQQWADRPGQHPLTFPHLHPVLRSTGEGRHFCGGIDLASLAEGTGATGPAGDDGSACEGRARLRFKAFVGELQARLIFSVVRHCSGCLQRMTQEPGLPRAFPQLYMSPAPVLSAGCHDCARALCSAGDRRHPWRLRWRQPGLPNASPQLAPAPIKAAGCHDCA